MSVPPVQTTASYLPQPAVIKSFISSTSAEYITRRIVCLRKSHALHSMELDTPIRSILTVSPSSLHRGHIRPHIRSSSTSSSLTRCSPFEGWSLLNLRDPFYLSCSSSNGRISKISQLEADNRVHQLASRSLLFVTRAGCWMAWTTIFNRRLSTVT